MNNLFHNNHYHNRKNGILQRLHLDLTLLLLLISLSTLGILILMSSGYEDIGLLQRQATRLGVAFFAMFFSRMLVEAFNYYQHYGLVRVEGKKYDSQHIWNHLKPISRTISFEITNHNDHHMDSYSPYHELKPKLDGPQMPSLFLCFLTGLFPPIWFNYIAKPRLKDWDFNHALSLIHI